MSFFEWLGTSSFSFLEGCTDPHDLVNAAVDNGYAGIGLADRMGIYGIAQGWAAVRAAREEKKIDFTYACGVRLHFDKADPVFVYPLHRKAYGDLCRFLSKWSLEGMPLGEKGLTPLSWRSFLDFLRERADVAFDFVLISAHGRFYPWVTSKELQEDSRLHTQDERVPDPSFCTPPAHPVRDESGFVTPLWLFELVELCGRGTTSALSLAYPINSVPGAFELQSWLEQQSRELDIPLLATTLPLYAHKNDQDLCDLVTSLRHGKRYDCLGYLAQANGERRLLSPEDLELRRHYLLKRLAGDPTLNDPFARGLALAGRLRFCLSELRYRYPREDIPEGLTSTEWLARLVQNEAAKRFPEGISPEMGKQLNKELTLIARLGYEDYFLTIWQVLSYARERKILFQGRGSAANSAVCYCLGITAIDPVKTNLLFERFLSLERREPPDIDVDFEHERREEVIQEVYRRYGRRHAAMVATVISFKGRMAVRETAKSLGFSPDEVTAFIRYMGREGMDQLPNFPQDQSVSWGPRERARFAKLLPLARRLRGRPRHLSIHTGGFVLSTEALDEMCILEPARKENRSVIPFDKDDVDALGWMKVDLLSLGMLTAIRKTFDLVGERNDTGRRLDLVAASRHSPEVYRAMCRGDTVGVFQIESRAQMNMLPRLAPKKFYDVVIEVAIVRPGPLQGGMVHPYLRRRQGLEKPDYAHPALIPILEKTLGVPIFQEQVMKMAEAVGDFTPGEADQLRKIMSGTWRQRAFQTKIVEIKKRLITRMRAKGISQEYCDRIYKQIEGFGEYGFPESHAASFALLTYASQWLKVFHPSEFLCALINSQPMGFYSNRSLIDDAARHGVKSLPPDIFFSRWDCGLEDNFGDARHPHVRLGLRLIDGLSKAEAEQIMALQDEGFLSPERDPGPSLAELRGRGIPARALDLLVRSGACRGLLDSLSTPTGIPGTDDPRTRQSWELLRIRRQDPQAPRLALEPPSPERDFLPVADAWTSLMRDHNSTHVSPGSHPVPYARQHFLEETGWLTAESLYRLPQGTQVRIFGLLSVKQKPPTAGGMCFLTLEDETGFFNLALMPEVYKRHRLVIQEDYLLAATGRVERSRQVDPGDPRTAAVSVRVQELWNPLLKKDPQTARPAFDPKTRDFH